MCACMLCTRARYVCGYASIYTHARTHTQRRTRVQSLHDRAAKTSDGDNTPAGTVECRESFPLPALLPGIPVPLEKVGRLDARVDLLDPERRQPRAHAAARGERAIQHTCHPHTVAAGADR